MELYEVIGLHSLQAILWVNLFKYQLELGHYDKAYSAILGILDPSMYTGLITCIVLC